MWQNEIEVLLSVLSDKEVIEVEERLKEMSKTEPYRDKRFPLSAASLNFLIFTVKFAYWIRRGKGIKIEMGLPIVCELSESPWVKRFEGGGKSGEYREDVGRRDEAGDKEDTRREVGEGESEEERSEGQEGEWV